MGKKKLLAGVFFSAIVIIFLLTTLKPIMYQTVGYTYDQGRDFLKAAEIVMTHKPTFLGPTTGINGLYHGAWYFYILTIPFLLFGGAPQGFYLFNLFVQLATFVLFFFFARKHFGTIPAFLFFLVICTSPYFIFYSLFVGNNTFVLPVLLGFLIINYMLLEKISVKRLFVLSLLDGLFLGMVGEFELSFGIFLIPTYFLAMLLFRNLRTHFAKIKQLLFFLAGLGIAFGPRILFELKHQFQQTKILLSFVFANKGHEIKPYWDIFQERFVLFKNFYFATVFLNPFISFLFFILSVTALLYLVKKRIKFRGVSFTFMLYLIGVLFFFSTLYKEEFWHNYYEGIQYIFIFALIILFSSKFKLGKKYNYIGAFLIGIILVSYLVSFVPHVFTVPKKEGLATQSETVNYILANEKNTQNYCVRVYTPPVIPHTYNYLFLYNKLSKKVSLPQTEWVSGTCWFITEPDPFKFRLKEWKEVNNPKEKAQTTIKRIKDITVTHYEIK